MLGNYPVAVELAASREKFSSTQSLIEGTECYGNAFLYNSMKETVALGLKFALASCRKAGTHSVRY
jgi:hypothetical protein